MVILCYLKFFFFSLSLSSFLHLDAADNRNPFPGGNDPVASRSKSRTRVLVAPEAAAPVVAAPVVAAPDAPAQQLLVPLTDDLLRRARKREEDAIRDVLPHVITNSNAYKVVKELYTLNEHLPEPVAQALANALLPHVTTNDNACSVVDRLCTFNHHLPEGVIQTIANALLPHVTTNNNACNVVERLCIHNKYLPEPVAQTIANALLPHVTTNDNACNVVRSLSGFHRRFHQPVAQAIANALLPHVTINNNAFNVVDHLCHHEHLPERVAQAIANALLPHLTTNDNAYRIIYALNDQNGLTPQQREAFRAAQQQSIQTTRQNTQTTRQNIQTTLQNIQTTLQNIHANNETIATDKNKIVKFTVEQQLKYKDNLVNDPIKALKEAFEPVKKDLLKDDRILIKDQLNRLSNLQENQSTLFGRLKVAIAIVTDTNLFIKNDDGQVIQTVGDRWKIYFNGAFGDSARGNILKEGLKVEDVVQSITEEKGNKGQGCVPGIENYVITGLVLLHPEATKLFTDGQDIEKAQFKAKKDAAELKENQATQEIIDSISNASRELVQENRIPATYLLNRFNAIVETNQSKINERNEDSKKKIEDTIKASRETLKDSFIEKDAILKKIDSILSKKVEQIKDDHAARKARLSNEEEVFSVTVEKQVPSLAALVEKGLDAEVLKTAVTDYVTLILWA